MNPQPPVMVICDISYHILEHCFQLFWGFGSNRSGYDFSVFEDEVGWINIGRLNVEESIEMQEPTPDILRMAQGGVHLPKLRDATGKPNVHVRLHLQYNL